MLFSYLILSTGGITHRRRKLFLWRFFKKNSFICDATLSNIILYFRTRIWFPLLSFFESEVDGIVPNEYEGPLTIINNLRQWFVQLITDVKESSIAKSAGTKLQEGAAMGEYSVVKLVDGIKRNLSLVEEYKTSRQRLVTIDKNIQAGLLDDCPDVELRRRNLAEFPGESLLKEFSNPPSPVMKKSI